MWPRGLDTWVTCMDRCVSATSDAGGYGRVAEPLQRRVLGCSAGSGGCWQCVVVAVRTLSTLSTLRQQRPGFQGLEQIAGRSLGGEPVGSRAWMVVERIHRETRALLAFERRANRPDGNARHARGFHESIVPCADCLVG